MSAENLEAEVAALKVEVQHLSAEVRELVKEQKRLTAQANRWKGAFGVILLVGGFLGWLASKFGDALMRGG